MLASLILLKDCIKKINLLPWISCIIITKISTTINKIKLAIKNVF